LVNDFDPRSAVDAQFSLPHAVVMALVGEPLAPEMYSDARLFDPLVRGLLQRIELEHDHEADGLFFNQQRLRFSVSILLTSGLTVRRDIEFPRDQPRFGPGELEEKFRTLARSLLADGQVEQIIETVAGLDRAPDLRVLMDSLQPASLPRSTWRGTVI
jgi:2-methylcitrate dehydratase PrpD